jgi:hypothetical protein
MRLLLCFTGFIMVQSLYAQNETTFYVKKSSAKTNERTKVYALDLFKGVDTLAGGNCSSILPAIGLYDSIAVFNGTYRIGTGKICIYPSLNEIHNPYKVILKLFRRMKDNTFKVIYMHSFVVPGKED